MLVLRALARDPDLVQMVLCGVEQLAICDSIAPYTATAAALFPGLSENKSREQPFQCKCNT